MSDDESEDIIHPMAIKSIPEAMQIVNRVMRFFLQHGNEELHQFLVAEKLQDIQIIKRRQKKITDYFYK